jgi:Trypsin-like peptidase domain/Tetratricopeptide Repeats-Sensor
MSGRDWVAEFRQAASTGLRTLDWAALTALSNAYVEHLHGLAKRPPSARVVFFVLREHERFEELEAVADAVLALGVEDPTTRRLYAQALVDGGKPAAALRLYTELANDDSVSMVDRIEARGGSGRCYKALFLVCKHKKRRREFLRRAVEHYLAAYQEDHTLTWHGINAVALLARAERDGTDVGAWGGRLEDLAAAILRTSDEAPMRDSWTEATACEALLGLGRQADALDRAKAFLETSPETFTIASFLRQLRIVWQLETTSSPGSELLQVLRSALLAHDGGHLIIEDFDVRASRLGEPKDGYFEKIFGADRYQTLTWYRNGLDRCRAVARIQTVNEEGIGTGFLVAGPDLHPALPRLVLLTNGHVIPEEIRPGDAIVVFHGLDQEAEQNTRFGVRRMCWYEPSRPPGLDTAILELNGYPAAVTPIPLSKELPPKPLKKHRAYVIGHPRGLTQPQFSLQDNILLDYDSRVLHYRSPTEGGSSGSPVFDNQWNLIGLHHAGRFDLLRLSGTGGTYAANEGIALPAIQRRLAETAPYVGDRVLPQEI